MQGLFTVSLNSNSLETVTSQWGYWHWYSQVTEHFHHQHFFINIVNAKLLFFFYFYFYYFGVLFKSNMKKILRPLCPHKWGAEANVCDPNDGSPLSSLCTPQPPASAPGLCRTHGKGRVLNRRPATRTTWEGAVRALYIFTKTYNFQSSGFICFTIFLFYNHQVHFSLNASNHWEKY